MNNIGLLINMIVDGLKNEFVIYGYSISWWQIYIFIIVGSILAYLIGGFLNGD